MNTEERLEHRQRLLAGAMLVMAGVVLELATRDWGPGPAKLRGVDATNRGLEIVGVKFPDAVPVTGSAVMEQAIKWLWELV